MVLLVLLATVFRFGAVAAEFVVTTVADSGAGSLRQAILDANDNPGKDLVSFNLPGAAPFAIAPANALPGITDTVIIDGTTQPGYLGAPIVGLVGTGAGTANGLALQTGGSAIRALFINRFNGSGIQIQNGENNVVTGCFIGTSPSGASKQVNTVAGIVILSSRNNRIGGTNAADRNLLSGNQTGVWIAGLTATGNVVQGNFIGTDVTGLATLGNGNNGVLVGGPGNTIGGTEPSARNLISGNGQSGVYINDAFASNNWVCGNFIGTTLTGASGLSNNVDGITIFRATHNRIGGSVPGAGNLISANGERGIYIFTSTSNASHNRIEGNLIGTDVTGRTNLGNRFSGVGLTAAHRNIVGGSNNFARNVISANRQSGVALDSNSLGNVIAGNFIGVDATGTNGLANALSGVRIEGASNTVGGAASIARNVISGNRNSGVFLFGLAASNNVLAGNYIGTDATGTKSIGNSFYGISLTNAPRNFIGTAEPFGGNLISGNTNSGLYLSGAGCTGNFVRGNWIGPDASGTVALPNIVGAISLYRAGTNHIGGAEPGAGNVLAGNENVTLYLDNSHGNTVRGNFIGLRPDGTTALPNFLHGIELLNTSSRNIIGGIAPGEGNRIANALSANYDGVRVRDGCIGNTIRGNAIFNNGGAGVNGLGIDWSADGPTLSGEPRPPTLSLAAGRHVTSVTGALSGVAHTAYTLDFYANSAPDVSPYGEGQRWIGAATVTTTGAGTANFNVQLTNAAAIGAYASATTTDAAANTSEFALTVPVAPSVDTDGDTMPDDFESAFGLNPNSAADAEDDADADGDGASNLEEFLAGTKPNDASSALRVAMQHSAEGTTLFLNSVAGETYRVLAAAEVTGPWTIVADNLAGTGGRLRVSIALPGAIRFFQVRAN